MAPTGAQGTINLHLTCSDLQARLSADPFKRTESGFQADLKHLSRALREYFTPQQSEPKILRLILEQITWRKNIGHI